MMRKSTLFATILLALSWLAYAGTGGEKSGGAGRMDKAAHLAKMKAELNLTDQQAQQVEKAMDALHPLHEKVMAAHTDLVEAKKANASTDVVAKKQAALKTAKTELSSAKEQRLKAILTPEQFAKWKQMAADHEAQEKAGHPGGSEAHHGKPGASEKK